MTHPSPSGESLLSGDSHEASTMQSISTIVISRMPVRPATISDKMSCMLISDTTDSFPPQLLVLALRGVVRTDSPVFAQNQSLPYWFRLTSNTRLSRDK